MERDREIEEGMLRRKSVHVCVLIVKMISIIYSNVYFEVT